MNAELTEEIEQDEIHHLLETFAKSSYRVKSDQKSDSVTEKCLRLFMKDYWITVVNNMNGELCKHYPSKIPLLECEKSEDNKEEVEHRYDANKIKESFKQARFARCRLRFVIPVILYEGKHICRSATLASGAEMYSRSGLDFIFSSSDTGSPTSSNSTPSSSTPFASNSKSTSKSSKSSSSVNRDLQLFDRLRGQDINVLRIFNVKYIIDLMVEKKKVKFGMKVTSSEKVDKENRYGEFCIVSVPYPGCEFFKEWKDKGCIGQDVTFDWNQTYVDAFLDIPPTEILNQLSIDWSNYKKWNLIEITQNYLKMILHVLKEGDKGVLVHCISGWDRTPMFVSLIRLSLWADGVIHKSLSAVEIVYLTLAYDWYLFGHNLLDRLNKEEEILFFCFDFLSEIQAEEYSVKQKPYTSLHTTPQCASPKGITKTPDDQGKPQNDSYGSCIHDHPINISSRVIDAGCEVTESKQSHLHIGCDDEFVASPNIPDGTECHSEFYSVLEEGSFPHVPASCKRSSSPLPVPCGTAKQPTITDCGSWQVISNVGSVTTNSPSPSVYDLNFCENGMSERWERLNTVRRIFRNAYAHKIATVFKPETGLASFMPNFLKR